MSERLKTLAGALLALMVVYGLFLNPQDNAGHATRPISTEKGSNGYYVLYQWLKSQNIKTYSLRERFTSVPENPDIPSPAGNILVTTLPYLKPLRSVEHAALQDWMAQGNTLLVLAGLNDTPEWSSDRALLDDLDKLTGVDFYALEEEPPGDAERLEPAETDTAAALTEDRDPDRPGPDPDELTKDYKLLFKNTGAEQQYLIEPDSDHPLVRGISTMTAMSHLSSFVWLPKVADNRFVLELASMNPTGTPILWQWRHKGGNGQIVVAGSGSLLSNRMIAQTDNRQFVINLIAFHLGTRGTVIFDDLHQGLSAIYDPEAFFADTRLHRTLYFIIALWLLYVAGSSNRLLDPQSHRPALRQSQFIEAIGGLINRRMTRSAVGLWMCKSWFNDLRANLGLPLSGEPVWQELDSMALLDKRLIARIRHQFDRLTGQETVDLVDLHNTLKEARKAIG